MGKNGADGVEFMISTNPGEPVKPLSKIASGGELSRIMLALKTVLADSDAVGTLIFDEIDTGVSGRAAGKIAAKLCKIAKRKQVICITHLAQIASAADAHYLIEKEVGEDASSTHIRLLDEAQRVEELSRILGGLTVTETTRSHARELLAEAEEMKKRDGIRKGTEMKQVGVVTEIQDGYAAVLVAKTSMCGENCGACKGGCKPGTQKGVGENRLRAGGPCRRPGRWN